MILYTKDTVPKELEWSLTLLKNKEVFLEEYLNYKEVVQTKHLVIAEHLNNMLRCPYIKALSVPLFTRNEPLRKKKEDKGYYNGICAPTYQMTPEENHYIRYEHKIEKMFDFQYFSEDDPSYLFEQSLNLVHANVPKLWQAMIIEFKPGTVFSPHTHPQFYLSSFNLNKADKHMYIEARGQGLNFGVDEPLLIFDSSYEHIVKEHGNENRIVLAIGSEF
jgi:hypothetical protein